MYTEADLTSVDLEFRLSTNIHLYFTDGDVVYQNIEYKRVEIKYRFTSVTRKYFISNAATAYKKIMASFVCDKCN